MDTKPGIGMIRHAATSDAPAICAIYNHYVATSVATFEESPAAPDELSQRIETTPAACPWLVAEQDGVITGYAYASRWKPRSGYRYTVEITVYLDPGYAGRGLGTALYASLLELLQQRGVHCVIAGIVLPNAASVALHEKFGFAQVAHFRENGFKFHRWLDVGYWQRVF